LGTIELALLALVAEISESDLDKTHELLLYGYLFTLRRQLFEDYLDTGLPELKIMSGKLLESDALLKSESEALGLRRNLDRFYLCYWKTFVPRREVLETVKSTLFIDCTKEKSD